MEDTCCTHKISLNRAFSTALLAVAATVVSSVAGYYLVGLFSGFSGYTVAIHKLDPYAGCQLFPEWITRAANLCRPMLLQSLLLWLSPYTKFDTPLTAAVFIDRGVSLGLSLRFCMDGAFGLSITLLPILHTLVTSIFVLFAYSLRDCSTVRPLRDTSVHFLIASGFSFIIYAISPWIL